MRLCMKVVRYELRNTLVLGITWLCWVMRKRWLEVLIKGACADHRNVARGHYISSTLHYIWKCATMVKVAPHKLMLDVCLIRPQTCGEM